jgi:hypothetical protein
MKGQQLRCPSTHNQEETKSNLIVKWQKWKQQRLKAQRFIGFQVEYQVP